tara:strand:- start:494 stop:1663 length:1170 start_codon:yes stop_codon:yes gene_type:complete
MSKFNGKNSLKTSRLAFERAKYRLEAFEEDHPHVYDFGFAERTFYGRVNRMLEPVVPKEEFLKQIVSAGQEVSAHRAMNFVVDQFSDMELHFSKACRMGVIPTNDPILSSLQVKRAYENPLDGFKVTSEQAMSKALNGFIINNKSRINNFDDFASLFVDHYINSDIVETVLLSDYMKSTNSNVFQSGLALDIGGLDFSDDSIKEEQMLNSPAFNYYINIAKQYGFRVSENNPGLLLSDLSSPVTINYRSRYILTTVQSIFDKQYDKTIFQDLQLLEKLLVDTFNSYVNLNPYNTKYKSCNDKTISSINNIKYISNIEYNNIIIIYINMKNFFEGSPLSPASRKQITQTALRIAKHDRNQMLLYIEDQFKAFYNQKRGSLTYFEKITKNT